MPIYDLICAKSVVKLIEQVNAAISSGWTPQGGLTAVIFQGQPNFYQAMVK